MGLALGAEVCGIGDGDRVLLPAYNCPSMVAPFYDCGADVSFYKVSPDLSVDLDSVKDLIDSRTKALVITHYFGFSQDVVCIRRFCNDHDLLLIEDCAHVPYGDGLCSDLGSFGDFAVYSLMKFFPVYDGGVLRLSSALANVSTQSGRWQFEAKMVLNTLERAWGFDRLRTLATLLSPVFRLKDWLRGMSKNGSASQRPDFAPAASEGGFAFDDQWKRVRMSRFSRFVYAMTDTEAMSVRRREIYQRMVEELSDLNGIRVLFPTMTPSTVPYVVPVVVDHPERVFPVLKREGVPIYRWEDIDTEACTTSKLYSTGLFQFPCHQSLRNEEITWMLDRIRATTLYQSGES